MSVRRLAAEQPEDFAFTPENLAWAKDQLKKYPEGRQASAVLPLLWRAQEQCGGWLPEPALRYVADMLDMAYIRVYEIATFYTMFNLAPVGRYYVQVCGTTPCWLRGADALKDTCRKLIGEPGHVTKDGLFSWTEVECLGACVNAPMVQINKDYYEDLTPESFEQILTVLREGRESEAWPAGWPAFLRARGRSDDAHRARTLCRGAGERASRRGGRARSHRRRGKEAGAAASEREAAVPKPPLRDSSGRRRK